MKKSLLIIAFGVAVGYVLGARAGRERYDALVEKANGVWQDPRVAKARREAARYAREQAPVIAERAQAAAKDVVDRTATLAKDVTEKTATAARTAADKTVTVARDARDRTVTAAADVAGRVGKARDNALEDFDDDEPAAN
ncbi:MAG: protoporphyrinogen oxidase [Glaciihabitans sp.]|nr:protoporphyrinogen oxidase [Glaciihabitans sp.]